MPDMAKVSPIAKSQYFKRVGIPQIETYQNNLMAVHRPDQCFGILSPIAEAQTFDFIESIKINEAQNLP